MGAREGGTSLLLKEPFHYLLLERDVQETDPGLATCCQAQALPSNPADKRAFHERGDVNSAISRGKEKRAERRLLPPAVASRGPSQMVLLTLSAEPTEKVGKEPPTSAAAGAQLDPAWHPSLAGCHEETRPLGCCWGSPAASDISGWEGPHYSYCRLQPSPGESLRGQMLTSASGIPAQTIERPQGVHTPNLFRLLRC